LETGSLVTSSLGIELEDLSCARSILFPLPWTFDLPNRNGQRPQYATKKPANPDLPEHC
jgi:hypothetical protein